MGNNKKKTALFSLSDQKGSVLFGRQLIRLGWEIVASKETVLLFKKNKIRVTDISDYLRIKDSYPFPPTLHPAIESALTAEQNKSIDLVYISTYPLQKGNDVGGHTILALAAKGKRLVCSGREDMTAIINELKKNNNKISAGLRQQLISKAYLKIINHYQSLLTGKDQASSKKIMPLLNGENPYQYPASLIYCDKEDKLALGNFKQHNKILACFTNMADFDCILQILCSISEAFRLYYNKTPYIAVAAKHGNPCGIAVDWGSPAKAIENALWGNPLAIWGGEFISNFTITRSLAEKLYSSGKRNKALGNGHWMLDLIAAPSFSASAITVLSKNKNRKIFSNKALLRPFPAKKTMTSRDIRGGFLTQPPHNYILDLKTAKADFSLSLLKNKDIDSLLIAWAAAYFSFHGGNEVALAGERKLIGIGGGPATVTAAVTAVTRARENRHDLKNSVFAADAFFPFIDAPQILIKSGCTCGIVPEGGKNRNLIKSCFHKAKVNVFYLPEQFRGFYRH